MRIGMVTACYKPVVNGVTRMVDLYKARLEAAGHEVTVFTLGESDPAGEEANVVRSPAVSLGETGYYFTFGYSKAARERLRQMEIIHCHHLFMSVEMAHRYGDAPIVYTNHTRYDLYTGSYTPLPQPTADAIMRQIWPEFTDYCDVVITPSESVRQVMRDFGVRRPIEVIPNGIDLAPFWYPHPSFSKRDFGVPAGAPLLIYVGRLAEEKNIRPLLAQFALAREMLPDLHLLLIGEGPQREKVRSRAHELGVASAVHCPGSLPFAQVGAALALADGFVTASVSEVHPLTVIEAMASGLPIVAVSSPGIRETVVHGQTGLLTSRVEGLAAAMVSLMSNPDKRQQLAGAARAASERYDIDHTITRTIELYRRLRENRPDLQRKRKHGRWPMPSPPPMLEQLGRLLRPPS